MRRISIVFSLLIALTSGVAFAEEPAAKTSKSSVAVHKNFDWSQWQRLPILDDGRIKPIDTLAIDTVTLVTARSKWTDPETGIKYQAPELLYLWITAPDEWMNKPVIRCEFRPLREILNDKDDGKAAAGDAKAKDADSEADTAKSQRKPIPREGAYVALSDILDWDTSKNAGRPVFRSKELEKRIGELDKAHKQSRSPETVGDTPADKKLNGKVAELFRHMQAFLAAREARNIFIVPGLDPRVLTRQTNPDDKVPAWVSLGALLRLDKWREEVDPTVSALMAEGHMQLVEALAMRGAYPVEFLPQLGQAMRLKSQLQTDLEAIAPSLRATREAYDAGDTAKFAAAMQTFARKIRRLANAMEHTRPQMTPPKPKAFSYGDGQLDAGIWGRYEPLELNERQMSFSAYPEIGSTETEITYNKFQPFRSAWIFFLVAMLIVLVSFMVKIPRTVYSIGLLAALGAILYSGWGFALRIIVAGRPPVTNMYETVIWVSFVVAALGFWFSLLPVVWPGLGWSWRLTGVPLRLRRNAEGTVNGIEIDSLGPEDRSKLLAGVHLPVQIVTTALRLAGFTWMVWFLTESDTSYAVSSLAPPMYDDGSLIFGGRMMTWSIGLATVVIGSWYFPRAILTLLGGLITFVPEIRREKVDTVWERMLGRRFFVLPALGVACFGMMLAWYVGVRSPDILNPRVGSITAVLRDNYWLTIHVLTIVSSYGAGALAWGLGNLAMLYYLFGKYRPESRMASSVTDKATETGSNQLAADPANEPDAGPKFDLDAAYKKPKEKGDGVTDRLKRAGQGLKPGQIAETLKAGLRDFGSGDAHLEESKVRPPKETATLATFGYKGMQVAVLLLAAGTILGGLWADVSWGRFWDWDPKEVWALISLLVYLVVLHGRFAGWVGTFGTNVGSVLCFSAILMSWYGVNFVLPQIHGWLNGTGQSSEVGLHSYATGAGGLEYVVGAVALNLLLVMAAWARYAVETLNVAGTGKSGTPESTKADSTEA